MVMNETITLTPGDIVVVLPDADAHRQRDDYLNCFSPAMASVWYVVEVYADHPVIPYFHGRLIHTTYEWATEADEIITVPGIPYRCVVQTDLDGTVSIAQVTKVLGHYAPLVHGHSSNLDGHDEQGNRFFPMAGRADVRWHFKESELDHHLNYVMATRRALLDAFPP